MSTRQTIVLKLLYNDPEDPGPLEQTLEFRGYNRLAELCGFRYALNGDASVKVPDHVLMRLMAALEVVHVLRPMHPVLTDDDPYGGEASDPFEGCSAGVPYWRVDPSRSDWEMELYQKLQPYVQYVATEHDEIDVYFFDMCDKMRDTLQLVFNTVFVAGEASLEARLC